ncbi:hypothetical protein B0H10DRAFT_2434128 [Mycena sp. CBHHK59/15]|nr:hypothetical protein B0H10DRAFT_2434128 [Mycena sp. CBHHK59/15]
MQWVRMISMAKSEFKLFLLPRVDNHTLRASMSCYCPTPSDSSHASQLIAAALRTPTPSPPPPPLPCKTARIADPSDTVSESPPPPVPVYNLYGLDYGTDTTSDTGSIRLSASVGDGSQYEHLFPLKLPLKTLWWPPIPVSECCVQLETKGNGSNDIGRTDMFGPVILSHRNRDIAHCQLTAGWAAHTKRLRTILWVRKLRRNTAKGALVQDVHDSI